MAPGLWKRSHGWFESKSTMSTANGDYHDTITSGSNVAGDKQEAEDGEFWIPYGGGDRRSKFWPETGKGN
ncbi:hypothetical protein BDV27DRAFT_136734 [Aspergillus caelatus]|uniref:Uncharacterized protein n=1 Tax=Aspergillus caelatus TaxID=61420 RepID=A0A5N6ZN41_9EURO|nr:uncharacterized protein BDV27DRAFT_136734 [Aspergillus caelatus]KAE8359042.1 hypothetical protein BDV27DRAFT_136734 [Aspergillus caelatus]